MTILSLSGDPNGTGTVTIAAPNTNTSRTINLPDVSPTAGAETVLTSTNLVLPSAALVATPVSGKIENTGTILTATPTGGGRGIIPAEQFYRLDTNLVGANATGAQSLFGVGVTLQSNTVYEFEISVALTKTAGTTSHTIGFGFSGTVTTNNFLYSSSGVGVANASAGASVGTPYGSFSTTLANVNTNFTTTTAAVSYLALIKGVISVNAAGTFIPQYSLSAAPGGAYSTVAGSYIKIKAIGTAGANTSVGAWS